MNHSTFTETDSIKVMQDMIANARRDVQNDNSYYLLWGWLTLTASLGHFILLKVGYGHPYIVWTLMIVGGIVTGIKARQKKKTAKVKTYVNRSIGHLWIAVSAGIVISLIAAATVVGYGIAYPFLIMLFGVGTYMSGVIFKFKPLMVGGILNWMIALTAFYVGFDIQLLLLAFAMIVSYLIPGYMIKTKNV